MSLETVFNLDPQMGSLALQDQIEGKKGQWTLAVQYVPASEVDHTPIGTPTEETSKQVELSGREHLKIGVEALARDSRAWFRNKFSSAKEFYKSKREQFEDKFAQLNEQTQFTQKLSSAKETIGSFSKNIGSKRFGIAAITATALIGSTFTAKRFKAVYS